MKKARNKTESAETVKPKRRRCVCHLAYTFYSGDNRVIRYAEALAERGDEVDVINLRAPKEPWREEINGIRFYRVQGRTTNNEKTAWTYLLKILGFFVKSASLLTVLQMRRRYDVVHVHNVPDFLVFAAVMPKLMGARIILDIHDIVPELYAGKFGAAQESGTFRWLLLVERLSCRFADRVIVANDIWRERLVSRAVSADKCVAMLNYPDVRLFRPMPQDGGRRDDRFIVLYPGSLNIHQGLDIAVKAFALVKDRMPGAEFHIYGSGPTLPQLVTLARERCANGAVKFMDGVPLTEMPVVMGGADVGVVPKRADGFGNEAFSTKILEFMACGVPVIVSRTRIDAHYFDDTLVRFFTSGDEEDLARALLWVYEHRSDHGKWIERAREFAVRNSWQERGAGYNRLVDSLVARPSAVGDC